MLKFDDHACSSIILKFTHVHKEQVRNFQYWIHRIEEAIHKLVGVFHSLSVPPLSMMPEAHLFEENHISQYTLAQIDEFGQLAAVAQLHGVPVGALQVK